MGAIKLTMAGTYVGLVVPISSIVRLLILTCRVLDNYVSDSFHGGLFRALANFRAVLRVNNSLVHRVQPASFWPCDSLS